MTLNLEEFHQTVQSINWYEMKMSDPILFQTMTQRILKVVNHIVQNDNLEKRLPVNVVDRIVQPHICKLSNKARPPKVTLGDLEEYLSEAKAGEEDELISLLKTLTDTQ
eukprot:NODE_806_length_3792_cov_0.835364.p3 type:complete len:109 gc:universal NODE_806_length_3792_cov_0.835364:1840-1514(-)